MKKFIALLLSMIILTACGGVQKLELTVGETVEFTGKQSNTPWQHMIDIKEEYPYINYIDFEGGDQRVVYTKDLIICQGDVSFKGTVIEIFGKSKDPNSDEAFSDKQITADEFSCVESLLVDEMQ